MQRLLGNMPESRFLFHSACVPRMNVVERPPKATHDAAIHNFRCRFVREPCRPDRRILQVVQPIGGEILALGCLRSPVRICTLKFSPYSRIYPRILP